MAVKKKSDDTFILVMPSFNEERRIKKTILSWVKIIEKVPGSEILIIDGNSTDRTRNIIRKLQDEYNNITLVHKKREGYGKDLITGYKKAIKSKHNYIFQTDTDAPFRSQDFFKLWKKRNSSPFIVGRRYKREDPKYRLILASLIEIWIIILFGRKIKDPNIPFRLINRKYLEKMLMKVPLSTIAPNIYLTVMASIEGFNLQHIPIKHYARNNNHNNYRLIKGALKGFFELLLFAIFKV